MLAAQSDEVTNVAERDGVVAIENRYWMLRVNVHDWLNPAYLYDKTRQLPLADENYAYELTVRPQGNDGFTGTRTPDVTPADVTSQQVRFLSWSQADLPA